jgi:hypothetical protein
MRGQICAWNDFSEKSKKVRRVAHLFASQKTPPRDVFGTVTRSSAQYQ